MKEEYYFLFGRPGIIEYLKGDLDFQRISAIRNMVVSGRSTTYHWKSKDPFDLLSAFIGFDEYLELNKEEYEIFSKSRE